MKRLTFFLVAVTTVAGLSDNRAELLVSWAWWKSACGLMSCAAADSAISARRRGLIRTQSHLRWFS